MIHLKKATYFMAAFLLLGIAYIASCTHKDVVAPSSGANIIRGTDAFSLGQGNWKLDKAHSSVMWETGYLGTSGLLTGRFNMFGVSSLTFNEASPESIAFEGWVRLNTVNTGEPGRDAGCLLGTFGTAAGKVDETENLARLKSKKVEFSKTDKGYIVTADLSFLGVTKEVTGKLNYLAKTTIAAAGTTPAYDVFGLKLDFQFLAKSDYKLVSSSVGDKAMITLNMNFNNK